MYDVARSKLEINQLFENVLTREDPEFDNSKNSETL